MHSGGNNGHQPPGPYIPICVLLIAKADQPQPTMQIGGNACVFLCRGQSRWVMAWLAVDLLG